jgi:Nucleotidyl transferase AbiEii toxin, Type IV TA system
MLQIKTVEPGTLALLKTLMGLSFLSDFSLVGGTALSLKYGHRLSIDLDLFSNKPFETNFIVDNLYAEFGNRLVVQNQVEKFGIFCLIDDIKVDIVKHPYELLQPLEVVENIRLYHTSDIAAMKVAAILHRAKKKDFWDLVELFKYFTLDEIIKFHSKKFPLQRLAISIPYAIAYFDDADESENPVCLNNLTWQQVKANIKKVVNEYLM